VIAIPSAILAAKRFEAVSIKTSHQTSAGMV
jgi:hypothetical protein